ncbi:glutaminase [Dermacoccaceae bacterium W4C1]
MKSPVTDYLHEILDSCGADSGATADYIPELADADPERFAACLTTVDGQVYAAGDSDVAFSIQSISKPFVYALALTEHGLDHVLDKVGVEPSGEAFNEMSLEDGSGRPLNPMINAGALTTHCLVGRQDDDVETRIEKIRAGLSAFAGRELSLDTGVFESELRTAYRNRAIANMLRSYGIVEIEPDEVVRGYTAQCSLELTAADLSMMAATLAGGGTHPQTGEQVVPAWAVRQTLSVMMTCGMYDAAGDWMSNVGVPAKSGVSGGIIGALPGQCGLATFSPRLDAHGNSSRGIATFTRLSADMGMHIMAAPEPARSAVRRDRFLKSPGGQRVRVFSLQGSLQFSSAERALRILQDGSADPVDALVLDLRRVASVNDVARRMLAEGINRLQAEGIDVALFDPERMLRIEDSQVRRQPRRLDPLQDLRHYVRD